MNKLILKHEYHSPDDDKNAKVFLTNEGYEVDYYEGKTLLKSEQHHDHSESWAEDCADNYVLGVKVIGKK